MEDTVDFCRHFNSGAAGLPADWAGGVRQSEESGNPPVWGPSSGRMGVP